MFKVICVTNRRLCTDFLPRISELAKNNIPVILREKDLDAAAYEQLAVQAARFCPDIIPHSYPQVAARLGIRKIHLPLHMLNHVSRSDFDVIGVSVHSAAEAILAEAHGANYVIAGHIFMTDCKRDLPPRGTDYLKSVVGAVKLPVYAIGGISPENIGIINDCGAAGACIMSGFMQCRSVGEYIKRLQ